jgi:hypothetical protein
MDYKFLLKRLPFIIFHPVKAWGKICYETFPVRDLRNYFLFPLIILVTLFAFTGSLFFINSHLSFVYSVFVGLKFIILLLFVVYASAVTHKEITYALDLGRNFDVSFKIIVYSMTPFFLCLVVSLLFDSLIFINFLALYCLYIFWIGSEKMLNPSEHKKMPMLIATLVVMAGYYISAAWILTQVIDRLYYAYFA